MADDNISFYHHHNLADGRPWLSFAKTHEGYFLRFHHVVDFLFHPSKKEIRYHAGISIDQRTIDHLLVDQVFPLIHAYYGYTVLHASAVALPAVTLENSGENWQAIAFLGASGQGKSTLTASFYSAGMPLLADDCLIIEEQQGRIIGHPYRPSIRLWPDSAEQLFGKYGTSFETVAQYTEKKRVDIEEASLAPIMQPTPVQRIYFLHNSLETDSSAAITITPSTPRETFAELVEHAFRLDITDKERLRQEFETLTRLSLLPVCFRISYPRVYSRLGDVREAILEHIRG